RRCPRLLLHGAAAAAFHRRPRPACRPARRGIGGAPRQEKRAPRRNRKHPKANDSRSTAPCRYQRRWKKAERGRGNPRRPVVRYERHALNYELTPSLAVIPAIQSRSGGICPPPRTRCTAHLRAPTRLSQQLSLYIVVFY